MMTTKFDESPASLSVLAAILFCTGVWGLINSRNAVRV